MRAKLIYEKFEEKSDPVKDLKIGGVIFSDLLDEKDVEIQNAFKEVERAKNKLALVRQQYNDARKKALDQFVGKKITAVMIKRVKRSTYGYDDKKREYTIKVKRTICREYENVFISDRNTEYTISNESKIFVHD